MQDLVEEVEQLSFGKLSRSRWNVLDLITAIPRHARPAYLLSDIEVTAAESLQARLASQGLKITITTILLKAISIAQLAHPDSRTFKQAWGNEITAKEPVAGFTVERTVEGQPIVFFAVIPEAHIKTLKEIGEELEKYGKSDISDVPQLAKELALTRLPWLFRQIGIWLCLHLASVKLRINSATFGLTSLGKLGIKSLLAPNVSTCVFGVGSVEQRPVAINNEVEVRKMMTLSLSVDTRIMNIVCAAHMMNEVKDLIETGLADHLAPSERFAEIVDLSQDAICRLS